MAKVTKRTWINKEGKKQSAWQCSYTDQSDERIRKQFDMKKDADAYLLKVCSEVRDGIHTPESASIKVSRAAEIWLEACKVGRGGREPVEPSTLRAYDCHVRLHINPLLGGETLSRLSTPRCADYRDKLVSKLSRATAKKVLTSFKAILNEAQSRGFISQNPARPISILMSSRHKKEVVIPGRADVKAILEQADKRAASSNQQVSKAWARYRALLHAKTFTGMRESELRGLYWSHIDFDARLVKVSQRADEIGVIGSVKSGAGRREIPLSDHLLTILREWKLRCPPGELVFPNWYGRVESQANIYNRCWVPICKRAGLVNADDKPIFEMRQLRHYRASALIASGATAKEVQTEIGHSSVSTTFDIYGHLFPEDNAKRHARANDIEAEIIG
jgi:integrase